MILRAKQNTKTSNIEQQTSESLIQVECALEKLKVLSFSVEEKRKRRNDENIIVEKSKSIKMKQQDRKLKWN